MTHFHLTQLKRIHETQPEAVDAQIDQWIEQGQINLLRTHMPQENCSLLIGLIELGLEDAAIKIIDHGADLNYMSDFGFSAVHSATCYSLNRVLKKLIECGADIDVKTHDGVYPLHFALSDEHANPESLRLLFKAYSPGKLIQRLTQNSSKHDSLLDSRKENPSPLEVMASYLNVSSETCIELLEILEDTGVFKKLSSPDASKKEKELFSHFVKDLSNRFGNAVELWFEGRDASWEKKQLQQSTQSVALKTRNHRL